MVARRVIVRASARKHGVADEDAMAAASTPLVSGPLDDEEPQRQLRVGFDTAARLLETVVLVWDDGTEEVIHAVRCRPQYLDLLG
ncbi:hypothetical protein VV38_13685 [Clavibacter nebraskensis]|uniref:Toxin n=2 Tax=Clavibacter nebraskensis TaxID=31963 RepID=A0A399PPW0_9MICO|nr:hypothetical protein VV38_13685 [Clavibacter nebraskensis]OAH19834.1 hypothetical protein A3Q38_07095 [Clavibacter nebraskensis]RIJ08543.1 hypothetical protein DZF97_11050 [Clavibacter nebraskensis]